MLKSSIQITLGIVCLCFAAVMWYVAVQEGLLTLGGIFHLICGAFSVDAAISFFRGSSSSAHVIR